jgi:hypothetical protein
LLNNIYRLSHVNEIGLSGDCFIGERSLIVPSRAPLNDAVSV